MFNTDQPIKEAREDILGRSDFASNLASAILSNKSKESLTIGLYGPWGSGKTSVLNLVDEEMKMQTRNVSEKEKPIILRFNPWNVSDQNQLLGQFFLELSSVLNLDLNNSHRRVLSELLEVYSNILVAASYIPMIGSPALVASKTFEFLGKRITFSDVKKDEYSTKTLTMVKKELHDKLKEIGRKIIIIIDDIDRLNSQEIRQIFQLVKVIADFPNSIYILSFDRNIVVNALQGVQCDNGLEYLEKIVQIPFEIPEVSKSNIHKLFFSKLDEILGPLNEDEFDQKHWSLVFHNGISNWINNVRDITRVINTFSLKHMLIKNESNFIDLLAIVTLEIFEPDVYQEIKINKDILTGQSTGLERDHDEKHKEQIRSIINLCNKGKEDRVENLLNELFPKVGRMMNKWRSSFYDERYSRKHSMICNPACFDVYFKLTLSEGTVSKIIVREVLFNMEEEEVSNMLVKVNAEGKIISFLDISRALLKDLKETDEINQRVPLVLKTLFMKWDSLEGTDDGGFFSIPFIWRLNFITEDLISVISNIDSRYSVIHEILTNRSIPIRLRVNQLLSFEHSYNRFTDKDNSHRDKLLKLEHVIDLEDEIYHEISVRAKETNDFELFNTMYFWKNKNEVEMNEFIEKSIITDEGLALFIGHFVGIGKASGDFVYQIFTFHKPQFEEYYDIKMAYERTQSMLDSGFANRFEVEVVKKLIAFSMSVKDNDFDSKNAKDVEKEYMRYLNEWKSN